MRGGRAAAILRSGGGAAVLAQQSAQPGHHHYSTVTIAERGIAGEARPLPSDQLAVPAEHRFRLEEQCGPGGPRERARQGGEDETISLRRADNLHIAF